MSCWQRISVLSQINAWSDLSWIESLVFFQVWLLWLWGQMQESRWWCTWKGFTDWRHAAAGVWWNDQGLPHFCENQLFGAVFIQLNTCCHFRNVEKKSNLQEILTQLISEAFVVWQRSMGWETWLNMCGPGFGAETLVDHKKGEWVFC